MSRIRKLIFAAWCMALCVVLPIAFHTIPNGGQIFLPMHIPVLLCGLVCGFPLGTVCGLAGPVLSSVITGMPPAPMLPSMMTELAVYGFVTGILMKYLRTGSMDIYISMISAMILGRTAAGLVNALVFSTAPFAWITTSLLIGIPGLCIQLVLIPLLMYILTRAKVLPARCQKS